MMTRSAKAQPSRRRAALNRGLERGVTLIELMISVFLAIILCLIIYSVVVSQSRAYGIQDQMTQVQQSLRFAMDFITRNVQMAGYGSNGYILVDTDLDATGRLLAIRGIEGGGGASDALQVVYTDPTKQSMTAWGADQSCTTTTLNFQNPEDAGNFSGSSYMICYDYSDVSLMKSFMLTVTAVNVATGAVTVVPPTNNTEYSGASGQCPNGGNLPRDLQCGPAQIMTFYIDRVSSDGVGPGSPTHPVLMMATGAATLKTGSVVQSSSDSALADDIEDLQVKVCSTDVSHTITCGGSGDWSNWNAAMNNATDVMNMRQVKLTLWARSDKHNPEGKLTVSAPNPLTGARDGYFRQMQATTILVRNLRMLEDYN